MNAPTGEQQRTRLRSEFDLALRRVVFGRRYVCSAFIDPKDAIRLQKKIAFTVRRR